MVKVCLKHGTRRAWPRTRIPATAQVIKQDGFTDPCMVDNLSAGGALLRPIKQDVQTYPSDQTSF